ncbi:MAG: ParB/RepB/Spo0J family partition protein [Candidatus Bathyarchaeia archaeon]|nr:ParB/RepB/Spo0J family partition protein [Candidatus Bathyarchaeia archaeon]
MDIDSIRPSPYQPRLIFDQDHLKEEIEKDGLLNDLVVRKQGDFYELIDGERRWKVLKELGWKSVPVRVVDADDAMARLSVYKLNKIRQNYTIEEEARYFRKLADEGMTPLEISKQLNVDFHWVLANINVFKFPEDIQKAVWAKQISMSHIVALESVIGRNIKEAVLTMNQILERKLNVSETRKIIRKRERELKARVDEARIKAAEKVLPAIAPKVPKLETPEEFEKTAEVLKEKAKKMRKGTLKPEEIKKMTSRFEEEEAEKKATGEVFEEVSIQTMKRLREKIETLEKEKESLLEKKGFLTQALSFNCPYCNHSCVIYREGDSYWVE